jgi:perosamine synthetase
MNRAKAIISTGYHQTRNLIKLLSGRQVTMPGFVSMTLDQDDIHLVKSILQDRPNWYNKTDVQRYESDFARWNGSQFAFSFMAGRAALTACIHALGLMPGDEVILPGYTCVAVPNAFHFNGIKTVYCDIELDTYGLDASLLEQAITPRTRAVLLHHLYGLVCRDYDAILSIARNRGLGVIEDCAHATGATYKGVKVGNRGDVAFYSSEQSKIFNTIQGGIAVTNNAALAGKMREFYDNASCPDEVWIEKHLCNFFLHYWQNKHPQRWLLGDIAEIVYGNTRLISTTKEEELGVRPQHYGRKMPGAIAKVACNQLNKIDSFNEVRRITAKRWDAWSEIRGYKKPVVISDSVPVYLRYPVMVEQSSKQDTSALKKELGVSIGVWFLSNIHPVPAIIPSCPNANKAVRQCVNLPCILE